MAIEMRIKEDTNLNADVNSTNDAGMQIHVMYLSAVLNADTFAVNINVSVNDKELYKANAAEMKSKYDQFKELVEKRANDLGYVIF